VLIVDDEPKILKSLEGLLEDDFSVVTTIDPRRALELLRELEVAVVLSDQRMPEMSGDEFLSRARALTPATRILITGYADLEALVRAVNEGKIYGYVAKPWSPVDLKTLIRRAADHYRLETQLRHERDLLRRMMDTSPHGNLLLDAQRGVLLANPRAVWLFGLDERPEGEDDAVVSEETLDWAGATDPQGLSIPPEELPDRRAIDSKRSVWESEVIVGDPKEGRRHLVVNAAPLLDEQGAVEGVVLAAEDVTHRRRLEDQLRQAQKMEAVGLLAGGVAHDFNNLLTAIGGFVELALVELGAEAAAASDLREVLGMVGRATALTRQLLTFSRSQPWQLATVGLEALVEHTMSLLRRLISEDIRLNFHPCLEPNNVRVDQGQIEQVLLNLAVNARDAMPFGGTLTLSTDRIEVLPGEIRPVVDGILPAGRWASLSVTDSGTGMDQATANRIFEPFFTTKPPTKGTGLGLSTVYGIVKQHRGALALSTALGSGSSFTVFLPLVPAESSAEAVPHQNRSLAGGGQETILVVEDEEMVRNLTLRVLTAQGYTVFAACDAAEAERLFADHADEIGLVVSDLRLPDIGGFELYRRLAARRPGLRVLFVSGYPDQGQPSGAGGAPGPLLAKPFAPQELTRQVRALLDASTAAGEGSGDD
jgi:signal transduction histidine kinase/two-component SAPR family response regulator